MGVGEGRERKARRDEPGRLRWDPDRYRRFSSYGGPFPDLMNLPTNRPAGIEIRNQVRRKRITLSMSRPTNFYRPEQPDPNHEVVARRLVSGLRGFACDLDLDDKTTRHIVERVIADMPWRPDDERLSRARNWLLVAAA